MKKLLTLLLLSFIAVFNQVNAAGAEYIVTAGRDNALKKIDSNGNEVWSFFFNRLRAVDVNLDNNIVGGGFDNDVRKIDPNGNQIWFFDYGLNVRAVFLDNNDFAYVGGDQQTLIKLDSNGNAVWTFSGFTSGIGSIEVDDNGFVYATATDGTTRKIDSNGNEVWSFSHTVITVRNATVDDNGFVYTVDADGYLYKLDSNGNQIWNYQHSTQILSVDVDENGEVYISTVDGLIKKINSNGNEVWSVSSTNNQAIVVKVDSEGFVYSAGFDNKLTKLDNNGTFVWEFTGHSSSIAQIAVSQAIPEPPFYDVELQTNTPYNDFIYQDDEVNVTTDSVITTILNDESFTVTSTAQTVGSYTFNYWFDLDNMEVFTTDRNFTILNPFRNFNLIADYTLDSFNTFNIDSNLPSPPDFELNTFTLEGQPLTINEYPFDNYQHPDDRSWEIIAPINNIGFYEFDYYYDNDANDIYDFNHIITGSGFSPPDLTAVYSLPEEYQINLIIESDIGNIIFQHGENAPISGSFISQTIGLGDDWTATAPNNLDYQFNFWFDLQNFIEFSNNQTLDISNANRDYYLEANYLDLVDINWDSAGGTPIAQQTVVINSSVQPPTEPERPGFIFDYWEDSDNNEVSFPQTITEDVTFTAIWLETFTVDFQVNGGAPVPSQTVLENDTINVVTPSRFGFTFEGWYTDNVTFNNEFDFNTPIDQDDTLFAKWAFGTEDNAEQSLNVFLVNSNLDDPFAQIIIVLAFFVLLNAIIYVYSGPMIVTLILNFILTALFMVLGFIPLWIIIMIFIAIFGFALLMLFGGRSAA